MSVALKIPVGDAPDWEAKQNNDGDPLNNVSESSSLCYSLRQSRNAWLTSIFPKFASKSKTKGQKDATQPPHNLRFVSKCDIEIGPHIFQETSVYEAHYLFESSHYSMGASAAYPHSATYPQASTNYPQPQVMSGTYSYPVTSYSPYIVPVEHSTATASAPTLTTEPADPSLDVTPALIAQVNEAAATNPTLHNLLQTAAAGQATMDQLRTLGFFIQSLATAQQRSPPMTPTATFAGTQSSAPTSAFMQAAKYSPPHASPKKPDLVLEFRENHTEHFLVPREIEACEQEVPQSQTFRKDIVLYTFVPFVNDDVKFKAGVSSPSKSPTVIRFLNVSDAIWETIRSWVNEEAKRTDAWDSFYDKTEASGPRTYLQYRLPSSDLISQLRDACGNGYTMKSIKPPPVSETTSSKRSRSRKASSQTARSAKLANDAEKPVAQAESPPRNGETVPAKEVAPKRQKSLTRAVSVSRTRTTGGLFFINTVAPLPPEVHPDAPPLHTPPIHEPDNHPSHTTE